MSILSFFSRFDIASKTKTIISADYYLFSKVKPTRAFRIRDLSRKPIVLGGCARSGTTLLLSVLSCHPEILAIQKEMGAFCPTIYNPNPDLNATLNLYRIYQYLNEMEISPESERWCEKTPSNVLYIRRILNLFGENVRFIHVVRDGRDVIISNHPLDSSKYHVDAHRWVQDVSAGRKYHNHSQVLTIRYEDLIEKYVPVVEQICKFIGVDFVNEFTDYPRTAKITQNVAWFQEASTISPQSIGKWKNQKYTERINELYAEPQAIELLHHFGYLQ